MKFCPECGNLIIPMEDKVNRTLMNVCRIDNRHYQEPAESNLVQRNVEEYPPSPSTKVFPFVAEYTAEERAADPTLPPLRVHRNRIVEEPTPHVAEDPGTPVFLDVAEDPAADPTLPPIRVHRNRIVEEPIPHVAEDPSTQVFPHVAEDPAADPTLPPKSEPNNDEVIEKDSN